MIGGIEASLRRIAHYDYWSEKVRRSVLVDAKADLLLYGNAERAVVALAHRLAAGEPIEAITDLRGSAVVRRGRARRAGRVIDATRIDDEGRDREPVRGEGGAPAVPSNDSRVGGPPPGRMFAAGAPLPPVDQRAAAVPVTLDHRPRGLDRSRTAIRLPAYEQVRDDPALYAHASRLLHLESNPGNARALVQRHGDRDVWINPPPIPLTTREMDRVFELPYTRVPHPAYAGARIPAYEMIRFSVLIMRGCFGGCTFCSITEHEGRIIQNRSEGSVLREIETIRDTVPGFTGMISDLGGPTANMWRLHCKDPRDRVVAAGACPASTPTSAATCRPTTAR